MKFFEKIIGCKNDGIYRVITILGIKFKFKNARRQIIAENNLNVGLIKVDLEGAEQEFLKGAEQTIRNYHKPSDFFELKPMLESWVPEYEFTIFNPVDISVLLETMIVAQPK